MKLSECLDLYNFKLFNKNNKEDTQVIRIYFDINEWMEIGVNDWGYSSDKMNILEKVFKKKILDMVVTSFSYDVTNDVFCIWVELE